MPQAFPDRLARKANQLYWETSRPAGQLAAELGVSRSKFYAMIEPLELGPICDVCEGKLVFGSRTDRESRRARCLECGAAIEIPEEAIAEIPIGDEDEAVDGREAAGAPEEAADAQETKSDVWLLAAAGVAVGVLVTFWLRRR